jgi:uncharacterized protein (TIGR02246 family)
MDDLERAEIEHACARLQVRYTHLVDFGEADRVADLFTPDGVICLSDSSLKGREAIRSGYAEIRDRTSRTVLRHVCTNQLVDVIDERTAAGAVYFTVYQAPVAAEGAASLEGPSVIGVYRDTFKLTDEGWRFSLRSSEVALTKPRKPVAA